MGKLNSLATRAVTGTIYVGIILIGIFTNQVILMAWLFALFAMLGTYEFQVITRTNLYALFLKIWHSLMAGLPIYVAYQVAQGREIHQILMALLPYLAYFLFYLIGEIYRLKRQPTVELGHAFFAHLYTTLPLALLVLLMDDRYGIRESLGQDFHFPDTFWILPIMVTLWLNDTGAYLFGSLLGKHRLFPRVSPNKSWEGAIGGAIVALLGGLAFYHLFPSVTQLHHWLILILLIVIFGNFGDLFESFIKRAYSVKDSGHFLPGHGGILDRIDSLLLATIPAFLYINLAIL